MNAIAAIKALVPLALKANNRCNLRESAEAALLKIIEKCTDHMKLDEIKVELGTTVKEDRNERMRAHRLFTAISYRAKVLLATQTEGDITCTVLPPKPAISIRPHKHELRLIVR
ncbi:MAG: hypothetical protein Q7S22_08905 [Candidatus Micrarchaeota archaeon]|nr:hypothetical protein [Candidatus Micrarchaeota archaeon]